MTNPAIPDERVGGGGSGPAPLVAHVIYKLDFGGLENGLVNLINELPEDRYRHAVICLTDYTDFARRIRRKDVTLHALHKPPGNSIAIHARLLRLFRRLRPTIVHSRNLAALEAQVPAWLAGVPVRIHGEHGRDMTDLQGHNRRHRWLRRMISPLVHHYVAVSEELADYLGGPIGVDRTRVTRIRPGVDTRKFRPRGARSPGHEAPFVVGAVGRMEAVKNPLLLARAFVRALELRPEARSRLRLVMVGDGGLRSQVMDALDQGGVADSSWLPGAREDVAELLRGFDLFVSPSLAEGASNTILEAMATGLPILATRVGGTPELVTPGLTGTLVEPGDTEGMARAILDSFSDPVLARRRGEAARTAVHEGFSLEAQVRAYERIYDEGLLRAGRSRAPEQR